MSGRDDDDRPIDDLADSLFAAGRAEPTPPEGRGRLLAALGIDGPSGGGGNGGASSGVTLKVAAVAGAIGVVAIGLWIATRPPDATRVPTPSDTQAITPPPPVEPKAGAPIDASERSERGVTNEAAPVVSTEIPREGPTTPSAHAASAKPIAHPSAIAAHAPPASAAVSASAAPTASAPSNDLAAELAALDRARGLIRTGDPAGALTQLDTYSANHPRGALATEALLLRIEALVATGRKEEARKVAEPLLVRRTGDMAGDRARKLLER